MVARVSHCRSTSCKAALALSAVLLLHGCTIGRSYRGVPLRADPKLIVEGQTTKAEVLRLFGPPNTINHQTTGDAFIYTYEKRNFSTLRIEDPITNVNWFTYNRSNEQFDRVVVLFDFFGVVRGVAYETNVEDMPIL